VVIGKCERSHHNDSEENYREGVPHARKIHFEGLLHAEREFSSVCHVLAFEARAHAARLLKFAHLPILWGISLGDYP